MNWPGFHGTFNNGVAVLVASAWVRKRPQWRTGTYGTVYGIELLNANEQLTKDHGNLIVETSGNHREIALIA
jgi:Tfp pilus assembly protein PilX